MTHHDPGGYIMTRTKAVPAYPRIVASGDTFLTTMGWLDQVEAGGGTAFDHPRKEQLIDPTKGALALWYGLTPTGHLQYDSSHGGCPVLHGSKWILNKWIQYFDQWKNYPCTNSNYFEPFKSTYKNAFL